MRQRGIHDSWIRTAAKPIFGAFAFLLLTSFLALPCLQGDAGLLLSTASLSGVSRFATAPSALPASVPASVRMPFSTAWFTPLLLTPAPRPAPSVAAALALSVPASIQAQATTAPLAFLPPKTYPSPSAAASSCTEHKIFRPQANLFKAFKMLAAENPLRFLFVLTIVLGFASVALVPERRPARARPGWKRLRSLPFATENPPHLACFAAQRDA